MSQDRDLILEKVARLIENLPQEKWLQHCHTEDQKNEWHQYRKVQVYLANCWRSKLILRHGDPIADALDRKEISQQKYDLIWLTVNEYKARWELIQVAEKYVKNVYNLFQKSYQTIERLPLGQKFFPRSVFINSYPFISDLDLFMETLKEDGEAAFLLCLNSYEEVSIKKGKVTTKQIVEIIERSEKDGIYPRPNPIEENKIKKFGWHRFSFSWLGLTLLVCQFAALNDRSLRKKMMEFNKAAVAGLQLAMKASRKVKSFTWIKGKKVPFSNKGGVPRQN